MGRYLSADPVGISGGRNLYAYVGNNPLLFLDFFGLASPGDLVLFNFGAAVVTAVDASGTPTSAFGAWGDTMTFRERDVTDIQIYIIGTADMTGLNSLTIEELISRWNGKEVAFDSRGVVTSPEGYGGKTLRDAMLEDFKQNPAAYDPIKLDTGGQQLPNPDNGSFFKANPWLKQFFINVGRYKSYR